jgi:hypothetical protein
MKVAIASGLSKSLSANSGPVICFGIEAMHNVAHGDQANRIGVELQKAIYRVHTNAPYQF